MDAPQAHQPDKRTDGFNGCCHGLGNNSRGGNNSQLILSRVAVRVEQVQGYNPIRSL